MGEVISFEEFRKTGRVPQSVTHAMLEPVSADLPVLKNNGAEVVDYATMVRDSMLRLVRETLAGVAKNGLPKASVLQITLRTEKAQIPDWLMKKFPDQMMIQLDQWWRDLIVTEKSFSVTLNFGDIPTNLVIPFEAIERFIDVGASFGLNFEREDRQTLPPVA